MLLEGRRLEGIGSKLLGFVWSLGLSLTRGAARASSLQSVDPLVK